MQLHDSILVSSANTSSKKRVRIRQRRGSGQRQKRCEFRMKNFKRNKDLQNNLVVDGMMPHHHRFSLQSIAPASHFTNRPSVYGSTNLRDFPIFFMASVPISTIKLADINIVRNT